MWWRVIKGESIGVTVSMPKGAEDAVSETKAKGKGGPGEIRQIVGKENQTGKQVLNQGNIRQVGDKALQQRCSRRKKENPTAGRGSRGHEKRTSWKTEIQRHRRLGPKVLNKRLRREGRLSQ